MFYRLMLVVLLILFFPSFARTQSVPLPNIDGWNMEKLPIDIKVSDSVVAYIGFELKYQNPTDPNEFVMVIMRSIPAVVARNESEDIRSFKQTLVESYTQKDEQDIIRVIFDERSDAIIYIKWRTKKDPRAEKVQDGDATVWFQDYTGEWLVSVGEKIAIEFMTELIINGKEENISVGRKYFIENGFHMWKIDRSDLETVFKEGEKK